MSVYGLEKCTRLFHSFAVDLSSCFLEQVEWGFKKQASFVGVRRSCTTTSEHPHSGLPGQSFC